MCINSCGINAYVEDGKLVKVEGMTEHPISEGYICPRGKALVEYVYSPDRVLHPMKKSQRQMAADHLGQGAGYHRRRTSEDKRRIRRPGAGCL